MVKSQNDKQQLYRFSQQYKPAQSRLTYLHFYSDCGVLCNFPKLCYFLASGSGNGTSCSIQTDIQELLAPYLFALMMEL